MAEKRGLTRHLAEAVTITLSILVAFGIDAWWDEVQERDLDRTHLETVLRELQTTAGLLDDAIRLHGESQDHAHAVLEMTSREALTVPPDSLEALVMSLWSSYVINPPTGALQAATASGALARLEDQVLKDRLLGWSGLLEDLLEEERNHFDEADDFLLEFLAPRVSLHGVYSTYGETVSGEVVGGRRRPLPPSRKAPGVESLLTDLEFENQVLGLSALAQSAEDEARAFRAILAEVTTRLEAELAGGSR